MRRHGFTLIELLVVVSIIALLIAILLPSLSKARRVSQGIVCLAHQHQVTGVVLMFGNDHKLYIPPVWLDPGTTGGVKGINDYNGQTPWGDYPTNGSTWLWVNTLCKGGYLPGVDAIGNDGINDFPTDPELIGCPLQEPYPSMRFSGGGAGYYAFGYRSHNEDQRDKSYAWWAYRHNEATNLNGMRHTSRQPLLIDSLQVWSSVNNVGQQATGLITGIIVPHLRHSGYANVATLDGSATAKSVDELFAMDLPKVTGAGAAITYLIEPEP